MTRSFAAGTVALALAIGACSAGGDTAGREAPVPGTSAPASTSTTTLVPGCGAPGAAPGVYDRTMTSGGVERRFQLTVPEGYDGTRPLPVVFALHGLTVNYAIVPTVSGFADMAGRYEFVTVAPSGRLDGGTPFWHAAPTDDNYDVAFVADLLDLLARELCIDPARVFSTGQSNGGQMSSVLACRLPERITAVAPVAGVEFAPECDGEPVPVMAFHGTDDTIVTYEGGGLNAATIAELHHWKGAAPTPVPAHHGVDAAMRNWAEHNGCDPEPVEQAVSPEVTRRSWRGCHAETVLYVVEGGGHTWPGRVVPGFETTFGHVTTDIDATELLFEFFLGVA